MFIFGLVLLFSFTVDNAFADIDRIATGGHKLHWWSWEETYTSVSRNESGGNVVIRCSGPGSADCPHGLVNNSNPYPDSYENDMVVHALDQIANNNLSGTYNANFIYNGVPYLRSVSWTGTNTGNNEITVLVSP